MSLRVRGRKSRAATPDGAPDRRRRGVLIAGVAVIVLVGVALGAVAVYRLTVPDPATSLPRTVEVHRDLTAVFVDELGEQPASVEVTLSGPGRCGGLFGRLFGPSDGRALWLEATWTTDQDLSDLDAAIAAGRRYLLDRDGEAEGIGTDAGGTTFFASADTAGITLGDYEASGGGSSDGAFVRTISTACVDPDTTDLAQWEARLESADS